VFIIGLGLSVSADADWQQEWSSTLDDIWAGTKAKSQELYQEYAPEQYIEIGVAYGTEKRKWFEWRDGL
jgi:hypothetical protein